MICYGYDSWCVIGGQRQKPARWDDGVIVAGWCGKISATGKHESHRNGDLLRTAGWTWLDRDLGDSDVPIPSKTDQESQANLIKLQKSSEKLQDELATEMKLATSHKARRASYCSI